MAEAGKQPEGVMIPTEELQELAKQFIEIIFETENESQVSKPRLLEFITRAIVSGKFPGWDQVKTMEQFTEMLIKHFDTASPDLWKDLKSIITIMKEVDEDRGHGLLKTHLKAAGKLVNKAVVANFLQYTQFKVRGGQVVSLKRKIAELEETQTKGTGCGTADYVLGMYRKAISAGFRADYVDQILLDKIKVLKYFNITGQPVPSGDRWKLEPVELAEPKAFLGPNVDKIIFHGVPPAVLERVKYQFMHNYRQQYGAQMGYNNIAISLKNRVVHLWRSNERHDTYVFYLVPAGLSFAEIFFSVGTIELRSNLEESMMLLLDDKPKLNTPSLA